MKNVKLNAEVSLTKKEMQTIIGGPGPGQAPPGFPPIPPGVSG